LIEFRDSSDIERLSSSYPALIQRDGDVVAVDGGAILVPDNQV
jgi:hypothetical protein